jgi:hypothetical protein
MSSLFVRFVLKLPYGLISISTRNFGLLAALFTALFFAGCVKVPTKADPFRDMYKQVQDDMKEAEVIEIFEGYESGVGSEARDLHPRDGKPLKRPSTFSRMFVEKKGAVEGDHFVEVYFDKAGYVVGKHFGEFSR